MKTENAMADQLNAMAASRQAQVVDSPRACARVVALALMSDGRVGARERDALRRCDAFARLGMDEQAFWSAMLELCGDLLALPGAAAPSAAGDATSGAADPDVVGRLLAMVRDPQRRRTVLRIVHECVCADGRVHPAESELLWQALGTWCVPYDAIVDAQAAAAPHEEG